MKRDYRLILFLIVIVVLLGFYFYQQNQPASEVRGVGDDLVGKLVINFLDVGQGDATLIRTPSGNDILIDGGPDNTVIKKLGQYMPYGDWDIELMILTHPHADHVTGLVEVLKRFEVDRVMMTNVDHSAGDYQAFLDLVTQKHVLIEVVDSAREECLEEVCFYIFEPELSDENLNNTSIVAKLVYASTSVMLMGDYENEENLTGDLVADILKSGHHGSNNANDKEFVDLVDPDFVVISVGADNYYGHPHFRALKNFERAEAEIYRTDRDGDIKFFSDGKEFQILNSKF